MRDDIRTREDETLSDSPLSSLVSACASPSASSGPLWSRSAAIMDAQVPHKSDKKSGEQCRLNANDPSPVLSNQSSPPHARIVGTGPPRKTPLEHPTHQPGACNGANGRYVPLPKRGVQGSLYRDTNRTPRIVPSRPQPGPSNLEPSGSAPDDGRRGFLWKLGWKV